MAAETEPQGYWKLLDPDQLKLLEQVRVEMRQPHQVRLLPNKPQLVALVEHVLDVLQREVNEPLSHALHRCWTATVGTPQYDKAPWLLVSHQLAYVNEAAEAATLCSANGPGPSLCCTLVIAHDGDHYDDLLERAWGHRPILDGGEPIGTAATPVTRGVQLRDSTCTGCRWGWPYVRAGTTVRGYVCATGEGWHEMPPEAYEAAVNASKLRAGLAP